MNRYIRSRVILNTNNKKFHQILQLTTENVIFASKSDSEKWLILNCRNSPTTFYAIKNNNLDMLILYLKICKSSNIIYQKIRSYYEIPTKELIQMNNTIKCFIKKIYDLSGKCIENSAYFYDTFTGAIIYFGNLQMLIYIIDNKYPCWYGKDENMLYLAMMINHKHIVKYFTVKKLIDTHDILFSYKSIFLSIYNYTYSFKSLYKCSNKKLTPKIIFRYCYWNIKSGHIGIFKYLYKKHPNKITKKTIKKCICIAKEVNNTKFLKYIDKKLNKIN